MAKKRQIDFETKRRVTSPIARCRWARLSDPDTTYKEEGEYRITIELNRSNPDHAGFIAEVEEAYAEGLEEAVANALPDDAKRWPAFRADEKDPDVLLFSAKMRATTAAGGTRRPALFDKAGAPFVSDEWVRNGSRVRVNAVIRPWMTQVGFGMQNYLNAVQIVELASADTAEAYGFDATEEANDSWEFDEAGA